MWITFTFKNNNNNSATYRMPILLVRRVILARYVALSSPSSPYNICTWVKQLMHHVHPNYEIPLDEILDTQVNIEHFIYYMGSKYQ